MKSKLSKRNEQVRTCMTSLELNNLSGIEDVDYCDLFHHTFFLGDLNYRLNDTSSLDQTVDALAGVMLLKSGGGATAETEQDAWEAMLRSDELTIERAAGSVFDGWLEPAVSFPPSYRRRRVLPSAGAFTTAETVRAECYSINTGAADDKVKTRKPSWCDRVLTHSLVGLEEELEQLSYDTLEGSECEAVTVSDHVPVISRMLVHAAPKLTALTPTARSTGHRLQLSLAGCSWSMVITADSRRRLA